MKIPRTDVRCEVLIIGGGLAALVAALEAKKLVDAVVIVSKSKVGRSGNTIVSQCKFGAYLPHEGSPDSAQQHFQDTLIGGGFINDEALVNTLVSHAGLRLLDLEGYGVRFRKTNDGFARQTAPGHSHPRTVSTLCSDYPHAVLGLSITLPLLREAKRRGVQLIEDTPIVRLMLDDGMVCGAIGLDVKGERVVFLQAKVVVLASGGGGQLFALTDNTRDVTGDSYALALEAGATLRDMEFVQFYPLIVTSPLRALIPSLIFSDGAVLRNGASERFMFRYDERGEMATRDVMSRALFREMQRGESIYLDCSQVPTRAIEEKYSSLKRLLAGQGIDLRRDFLPVSPTTHFFMGGVEIDERCRTSLPGLYAAGEAAGGVHGANRLGSNALSEALVFGVLAGQQAAHYARGLKSFPVARMEPGYIFPYPRRGDVSLREVRGELRQSMWEGASIVRSEDSLQRARAKVQECQQALEHCSIESFAQAAKGEEIRRMCLAAKAIVAAALQRRESRGAHYREDFPSSDDNWLGSLKITKSADGLELDFVPKSSSFADGLLTEAQRARSGDLRPS
jgi:succinate dehydrogenase/fumarate reductase flavoprotein subunit